jgi:site-specific DNA-methyltransferase (adenine-specific)
MSEEMARGVCLFPGDCLEVLAALPADHFDSCVCDPPYGLEFMGVAWDTYAAPKGGARSDADFKDYGSKEHARDAKGQARVFRNKNLAFGEFCTAWTREVYRVLKPGAHLVAFGGTRTYHRLACAIEDAGFEIRDQVAWVYGQGFSKSLDVSKAFDKAAGAKREVVGPGQRHNSGEFGGENYPDYNRFKGGIPPITAPATDAAKQWDGWGTALKPAWEPIVLARKPLSEGTVAANVLRWGTGPINVDGCRVETGDGDDPRLGGKGDWSTAKMAQSAYGKFEGVRTGSSSLGRWPANLVHDGSEEVLAAFPDAPGQLAAVNGREPSSKTNNVYGQFDGRPATTPRGDSGSAARFFYTAKADIDDRLGSKHPTVKPVDLMQWLCRLVTPPGGLVLDPFAGTGTTGEAAWREGMRAVLIEREAEYQADIRRRMALMPASTAERRRQAHKEKQTRQPLDNQGTLFE